MTETALEFVWYLINKGVAFVFDAQILPGVTIGSLFISLFIFGIVLNTLLRVPDKFKGSIAYRNYSRSYSKSEKKV